MSAPQGKVVVLMADDDEADIQLARKVFEGLQERIEFRWVTSGDSLIDYLRRRGSYANVADAPRPGVVLLDLHMPGKTGWEVLREIKSDPDLKRIPMIVLTTSNAPEDIIRSYDSGANAYMTKPTSFEGLRDCLTAFERYWIEIAKLP